MIYVIIGFGITLYVSSKIRKSFYLSEKRRKFHLSFIWAIPFAGPLFIRRFWKQTEEKKLNIITKNNRKTKQGGFYESGNGMY